MALYLAGRGQLTIYQHVQLERRFIDIGSSEPDDDPSRAMVLALRNEKAGVTWDKLLAQDAAIVLGGAGSGKTAEITNQATKLREAGVAAFVIKLESLCRQPLTQSFLLEDNSGEIFKKWQRQGGKAVAFLDALDEARLPEARNASVLQDAMAKLSEGVGKFGQFLSLAITTRPSEWHGQSDLDIVKSAVTQMRTSAKTRSPDIKLKVFRLAALDIDDCRAIATSRGADAGKFIKEVNRSLSADLLSQPLDIHFLLDVWNGEIADGKKSESIFSSKLEVYEKVISVRLRAEKGQERRSNVDPIAARYACEKLAAAALLASRRDFRAENFDPDALDVTTILGTNTEHWSEAEVRQLLSCGLFHPSVGGRVRFAQGSIVCNKEEAENAFRFSFCNLNGFPDWLPSLVRDHQSEFASLSDKFVAAIWNTGHAQGEFPAEPLSKIAYSNVEIRNLVAPPLFERLKLGKPSKIPDFEIVVGIVSRTNSIVKSDLLPILLGGFKVATSQFEMQVAWIWLDGLFNIDANVAWTALTKFMGDTWQGSAASLWMSYIGREPRSFSKAEERQLERNDLSSNAHVLGRLVRASYIAFPPDNDPHHEDVYSPDQKDRAANGRRYYLNTLGQIGNSEALAVLDQLSSDQSLKIHKDTFLYERDKLVRNSARRPTLDVSTTVVWLNSFTKSPSSVVEFRSMVLRHLKALLSQLKNSDDDEGYFFRRGEATEDDLRNWLSARLREVGRAWYEVIREQEVAVDKRPDLRVHARQSEFGNVSIEIKLADKGRTGDVLVDKIKSQLVDQYMHEYGSHTGIYLVVNAALPTKKWFDKDGKIVRPAFSKKVGGKKMNFAELVIALETRAAEVSGSLDANKTVVVEAIDLMR